MAHFAKVNNGIVEQVIVAESEFFDTFIDNSPGEWIQTSYNTHGGVHATGDTPIRANHPGIGFTYDYDNDVFYSPKPFKNWILNQTTFLWESPIPYPEDGFSHMWDEDNAIWEQVSEEE